jgi:hypothetical protein
MKGYERYLRRSAGHYGSSVYHFKFVFFIMYFFRKY